MRPVGSKYTKNTFAAVAETRIPDLRGPWKKGKRKEMNGSTENTPK